MVELLGNKRCLESLQNDVDDVHEATVELVSRVGPISLTSWKFPDKQAGALEMEKLLQQYCWSEEEEERQLAHISLLELLIDSYVTSTKLPHRLVLLVAGSGRLAEQLVGVAGGKTPGGAAVGSSAGLVVRRYWTSMTRLHTAVQQLASQVKTRGRKVEELEVKVESLRTEIDTIKETLKSGPGAMQKLTADGSIAVEYGVKSSQTRETSFVPCECCDRIQKSLWSAGDIFLEICEEQGLPSSLARYRTNKDRSQWMSANDTLCYMAKHDEDVNRIKKQLQHLVSTIEPLKGTVAKAEEERRVGREKLAAAVKELKYEQETRRAQARHYESRQTETETNNARALAALQEREEKASGTVTLLQSQLTDTEAQLRQRDATISQLESKLKSSEGEVADLRVRLGERERDLGRVRGDLTKLEAQGQNTTSGLAREQERTRTAARQAQSLQERHAAVLEQLGELSEEAEVLRQTVAGHEDDKTRLRVVVADLQQQALHKETELGRERGERQSLDRRLKEVEEEKSRTQEQLRELKEQHSLLLQYPDMTDPPPQPAPEAGDTLEEMRQQMRANELRIQLLSQENSKLQRLVDRLLQTRQAWGSKPVPLWKQTDSQAENDKFPQTSGERVPPLSLDHQDSPARFSEPLHPPHAAQHNIAGPDYATGPSNSSGPHVSRPQQSSPQKGSQDPELEYLPFVGQAPVTGSRPGSRVKTRPLSGAKKPGQGLKSAQHETSSFGHYSRLKKAGLLQPASAKKGGSTKQEVMRSEATFTCTECDKMYTTKEDLLLHRNYCAGSHATATAGPTGDGHGFRLDFRS